MERLLYGAAYYEEYLPVDRLEKDVEMMKAAGINVVRIAESTWSTCEPQDGVFDFSHVERVLDAMEQAGISVIIGTPTYAVPTWMDSTAILVSNEALTALEWFPVNAGPDASVPVKYNDIVRWIYDALYRMNIECDFVWPDSENIEEYDWVIVPALYAAPEALLHRLNRYVEAGGGVYGASAATGSSCAGVL